MKSLIKKILKEETLKDTLLNQIMQNGWLETSELVGGSKNLISVIGEDKIIELFLSCFEDLKIEKRGGDIFLTHRGLPLLEKSPWVSSLMAFDTYIEIGITESLGKDIIYMYRACRRDFIRELVKKYPELDSKSVTVYENTGLYKILDTFKL